MPHKGDHFKYTPRVVTTITRAIKAGASKETAALAAGVDRATLARWYKEIPEFAEKVDQALAARQISWLRKIEAAMVDHWQAAAWKLERTDPKQWGRRVAMEFVDAEGNTYDPNSIEKSINARLIAIAESSEEGAVSAESNDAGDDPPSA